MRRMIAGLLALAVALMSAAWAETRETTIYVEGEPENVTQTLYESGMGFSFWYDAECLEVDDSLSEDGMGVLIAPRDTDQAVYMELMSAESVGMSAMDYLALNAGDGVTYERELSESGAQVVGYRQTAAFSDSFVQAFYVIEDASGFVAAAGTWPIEMEEGWGARLTGLLYTVSLEAAAEDEGWSK